MQATTPEDNSFFPREKEELPWAGLQPMPFCFPGRPLYQLSHRGSSAGQAESLKFIQGKWRLSPDKQGYSTSVLAVADLQYIILTGYSRMPLSNTLSTHIQCIFRYDTVHINFVCMHVQRVTSLQQYEPHRPSCHSPGLLLVGGEA